MRDFPYGWWVVLTMFEGGTVEGYCVGMTDAEIFLTSLVFRDGVTPGQSELAIELEAVERIDAYRERPPR